jgi:hypothetical protein
VEGLGSALSPVTSGGVTPAVPLKNELCHNVPYFGKVLRTLRTLRTLAADQGVFSVTWKRRDSTGSRNHKGGSGWLSRFST